MAKKTLIIVRNAYAYDFGGAERFAVFLAESVTDDYSPVIISRHEKLLDMARSKNIATHMGWWWSWQNWSGWRIILFPAYILWQILLTIWYLSVFARLRPTVVHLQSKDDFIAGTIAAKILGVIVIWTDHADLKHVWLNVHKPFRNLVGKTILSTARFADAITVVSNSERNLVTSNLQGKYKDIEQKISVVHNGVEDRFDEHRIADKAPGQVFCVASRLVADKGIAEVIEAFIHINKDYPSSQLLIMGDGPEAKRFKNMAGEIDSIKFLGHVNQPLDVMARSDIFVHPTYHEGFSVALVEASMMGVPIIATDVGGNPEIILDEITGLLVPAKASTTLETAMRRLITDDRLREKLSSNARAQYLERFEFGSIVTNYFLPLYTKK